MKKYTLFYLFLSLLLIGTSCSEQHEQVDESDTTTPDEIVYKTFQERAKAQVEKDLEIPGSEKYSLKIYYAYINNDTVQDAIVTVNRMEYAIDQAIKSDKQVKLVELDYLGNYNFFFYFDGAMDKFSVPLPVPSCPGRELDVDFKSIVSPSRKDVIIGYRIQNSGWLSVFSVLNEHDLALVFQWKSFEYAGTSNAEALLQEYGPSDFGIGKDIFIYESELDNNYKEIKNKYEFEPLITKKNKLLYRFLFDPKYGKFRLYADGPGAEEARRKAKMNAQ